MIFSLLSHDGDDDEEQEKEDEVILHVLNHHHEHRYYHQTSVHAFGKPSTRVHDVVVDDEDNAQDASQCPKQSLLSTVSRTSFS